MTVIGLMSVVLVAAPNANGESVRLRAAPNEMQTIDLRTLPQVEQVRQDLQYARRAKFRGVPLQVLLARLGGAGRVAAHFANGMVVPLPDEQGLKRLDILVATEIWDDSVAGHEAYGPLPPAHKPGAKERDVRPTQFKGNKWVVRERWHPLVPEKAATVFSPWMYIDSLVELARIDEEAWRLQFPSGLTALEKRGREIFEQRCRFCHGARRVGASFGWDFVEPIPLHTFRSKESLFMHVRYRAADAPEKGYWMPELSDLKAADAEAVWHWMRSLAPDAGELAR